MNSHQRRMLRREAARLGVTQIVIDREMLNREARGESDIAFLGEPVTGVEVFATVAALLVLMLIGGGAYIAYLQVVRLWGGN